MADQLSTRHDVPRIAVVSTPRSGNTWLRSMLAGLTGALEVAYHDPDDIEWPRIGVVPCLLQIHWYPTPEFLNLLKDHGYSVVAILRHPCDVLLSILHFASRESETAKWLLGRAGNEGAVKGKGPTSAEFLEYATGDRAAALLGISAEWVARPDACCVRYEDLVSSTSASLEAIVDVLGLRPMISKPIAAVVKAMSIENLRKHSTNDHYWQGTPGLWRKMIVPEYAEAIALRHAGVFERLGYHCNPDPGLTAAEALRCWNTLDHPSPKDEMDDPEGQNLHPAGDQ